MKETLNLEYEFDGDKFSFEINGTTQDKACKDNPQEIMNKQIKILYRVIFELDKNRMKAIKEKHDAIHAVSETEGNNGM